MRRVAMSLTVLVLVSGSSVTAQQVAVTQVPGSVVSQKPTVERQDAPDPDYIKFPTNRLIIYIGYRRPAKPVTPYMQFYRVIIGAEDLPPDPMTRGRFVDYLCWGEKKDHVEVRVSKDPNPDRIPRYVLNVSVGTDPGEKDNKGSAIISSVFENFEQERDLIHLQVSPVKDDLDYQVEAHLKDFYFLNEFSSLSGEDPDNHVVKDMSCKFQLVYDSNR